VLSKLRKELDESRHEIDRVQKLWLEAQKTVLKSKDQISALEREKSDLQVNDCHSLAPTNRVD
jgi:septal ring factor EnvC (AmiA/AmiB activator)